MPVMKGIFGHSLRRKHKKKEIGPESKSDSGKTSRSDKKLILVDESGDVGSHQESSRYFIVSATITDRSDGTKTVPRPASLGNLHLSKVQTVFIKIR